MLTEAALLGLTLLATGGLILLAWRGEWLIPLYVAASIGLICITPWPGQFARYLVPVSPMLALGLAAALSALWQWSRRSRALAGAAVCIAALIVTQQVREAVQFLGRHHRTVTYHLPSGELQGYSLLFYDRFWRAHDEALDWLGQRAPARRWW